MDQHQWPKQLDEIHQHEAWSNHFHLIGLNTFKVALKTLVLVSNWFVVILYNFYVIFTNSYAF